MALLCCSDGYLAVGASTNVFVVSRNSGEGESSGHSLPEILSAVIDDSTATQDDDSNDGPSNESGEKKKTNEQPMPWSPQVLTIGFSPSGRLLAASNNRKQLIIWRLIDGKWGQEKHWTLDKQATALAFSGTNENGILVADRSGQVTEYNLETSECSGKILLGHLSILLDLCLSKSQRYLITADRDEKIRVSHYPKAYDIQAFCLGHTEYVRTVCLCPGLKESDKEEGLLASGGGDGYLILWRFVDGIQLASFDLGQETNGSAASGDTNVQRKRIRKVLCVQKTNFDSFCLVVAFEGSTRLHFVEISCTSDGAYSVTNTAEWEPERSQSHKTIVDIGHVDGRIYVLLAADSGFSMAEIDVSSAIPVQLPLSPAIDSLIKCKDLEKCMANSKEELPPMLKVVQFDNVGEYLERKKARIEGRSK